MSSQTAYAHPESLVSAEWLADHLNDPKIRIIESNEDILLFDTGHIPGAVHIDWHRDLNDSNIRDYIQPTAFADLCRRFGIESDTLCVFYGDKANWWACYAFWVFSLFGHRRMAILNGGRQKWIAEGHELTKEKTIVEPTQYPVPSSRKDEEIRAFFADTLTHSRAGRPLVDVRSPGEFKGEITHMPEYPQEGVLRGGHIPGASSVPWKTAAYDDGTFKSREELEKIYSADLQLQRSEEIITYCRIGERSSHTWFVLTKLLGYDKVRNYDGSWTEWGNMVRAPIEK
jgi:thiosulfate/3-mercaptopyruvate sulfurtransferase